LRKNTPDAGAESEETEDKSQEAWNEERHEQREVEIVKTQPEPGQLLPIEEHHEIG
jgi:hypothetical protein